MYTNMSNHIYIYIYIWNVYVYMCIRIEFVSLYLLVCVTRWCAVLQGLWVN